VIVFGYWTGHSAPCHETEESQTKELAVCFEIIPFNALLDIICPDGLHMWIESNRRTSEMGV
jgi:hypothetical protein